MPETQAPPPDTGAPGQAPRPPEGPPDTGVRGQAGPPPPLPTGQAGAPPGGPPTPLDRVYEMARSTGMPRWAQAVIGILSALIFVIVAANVDLGKTLDAWFSIQAKAETAEQGRADKAIAIMGDLLMRQQKLTLAADEAQAGLALERGIEALGVRLDRIAEALARDSPCSPRSAAIRGGPPSGQEMEGEKEESSTEAP